MITDIKNNIPAACTYAVKCDIEKYNFGCLSDNYIQPQLGFKDVYNVLSYQSLNVQASKFNSLGSLYNLPETYLIIILGCLFLFMAHHF